MLQVPGAQEFSEEAFAELFAEFDEDGSGTIDKPELV
jgi:Ca2+-binding EF-hand superfamily protein